MAAAPSRAAITDVSFHGFGSVTYSFIDTDMGIAGPPVGTTFELFGNVHLGTAAGDPDSGFAAAPPDGFTGHYAASADEIFYHYVTYGWSLGAAGGASSLDQAQDLASADLDFVGGRLTGFSLVYVGDPDGHSISATGRNGRFAEDLGYYSTANWGGVFTLDASAMPEPGAWALMLVGFGASGAALRRRTRPVLG